MLVVILGASTVASAAPPTLGSPLRPVAAVGVSAVQIVMDVSGSMNDPDPSGTIKLNGAKRAVLSMLDGLPRDIRVGLRTYPAGGGCDSGTLQSGLFDDRDVAGRKTRLLTADGSTPTAAALEAAADDLRSLGFTKGGVIVLVSDGESNCDVDPCETARAIARSGLEVRVNTIGFDISDAGAAELQCIAAETDGQYREVDDSDELIDEIGALTGSELGLTVASPSVVVRSVGRGTNESVRVRATIRNTAPNDALDVRANIVTTSERRPFVVNPVRAVGNIVVGDSREVVWEFVAPLDFQDADLSFRVEASAENAATVSRDIDISLRGEIRLEDAGPLLQDRDHVVVMGDSYSAGEGAGSYHPDTDTATNPCHRSDLTYGADLFERRTIIACSGAVTSDLADQQYPTVQPQLSQLMALDDPADLVLLTLGGNDAGFSDVIKVCALPGECHLKREITTADCSTPGAVPRADPEITNDVYAQLGIEQPQRETTCVYDHGAFGDRRIDEVTGLHDQLLSSYLRIDSVLNFPSRVRERGGVAPIVVLAYPSPVPDPTRYAEVIRSCPAVLSYDEWVWTTTFQRTLNATIEAAVRDARAAGAPVYYVPDSADAFEPYHTICDVEKYINYIDPVVVGGAIVDGVLKSGLNWITLGLLGVEQRTTPTERERNQYFHPNANGYRAMTAALVEWSTTPPAQEPVVRDRPPQLEVLPIPEAPPIQVEPGTSSDGPLRVERGRTTPLEVRGLDPGATAVVVMESSPQRLDTVVVDGDGMATLSLRLADDFPAGRHTVTVASTDSAGFPVAWSWPVEVSDPAPSARSWAPILMLAAFAVSVLCLGSLLVVRRIARRRS